MQFTRKSANLLCMAALLTISGIAVAQDNVSSDVIVNDTAVANDTLPDPALDATMGNDLGPASNTEEMAQPTDDTLANDMALADTAPPREDNDFPWGLLGLLGLAGLLGRKKRDEVHVDERTGRRDV